MSVMLRVARHAASHPSAPYAPTYGFDARALVDFDASHGNARAGEASSAAPSKAWAACRAGYPRPPGHCEPRTLSGLRRIAVLLPALASAAGGYTLLVRGALTLDLDLGRRVRPLGPISRTIAAPPATVFDVIACPYLGRTPRALQDELEVLERGSDMVLAAHFTTVGRLTTTTVETVRFERPHRVTFRLVRGPVPYVVETYELGETPTGTEFTYSGELGADLWQLGEWWADRVAQPWERTVAHSLDSIQAEAERRARTRPVG